MEHWDHLKVEAHERAIDRWYMSLPAFRGQDPPDPPDPLELD